MYSKELSLLERTVTANQYSSFKEERKIVSPLRQDISQPPSPFISKEKLRELHKKFPKQFEEPTIKVPQQQEEEASKSQIQKPQDSLVSSSSSKLPLFISISIGLLITNIGLIGYLHFKRNASVSLGFFSSS